ncbi:MAG: amino acid permease [Chthoniobacteraceae bacterium]
MNPASRSRTASISLFTAAAIVVSNMVGTGIFTSLGFQVGGLPSGFVILLLWALGGLCAMCGALCYTELAAALPRSGGEYHLLGSTLHPALGFVAGWLSVTVGFSAPIALAAMALGQYASGAIGETTGAGFGSLHTRGFLIDLALEGPHILALIVVTFITFVHLSGLRLGSTFQNTATVTKIALILILLGAGFMVGKSQPIPFLPQAGDLGLITSAPFAVSLIYVMYSYTGWNAATYIVGEIRDPGRTVPRAIIGGTIFVTLLYLGLNTVFLRTTPIAELKGEVEIGLIAGRHIFGGTGGNLVGGFICLGLVASISAMTWIGPRVAATMGEDFLILHWLRHRNQHGVPDLALWLQWIIICALILTAAFDTVLVYIQFALTLSSFLVVIGFCRLRWRQPNLARPFRAPWFPLTPIVFLAISGWMLVHIAIEKPLESLAGLGTLGAGLIVYHFSPKRSPSSVSSSSP